MNGLYEDIDEDLDELDDESWRELDDESLAERRRKRRNRAAQPRGGGYNQPRLERTAVSQTQLQAALVRVGEDVKKLAASVYSLESRVDTTITRTTRQNQGLGQMAMLMPLLLKKSVAVNGLDSNGIRTGTRVLVDDNDALTLLLPMMMMGSYGGSSNGNGNGQDMMMMVMMMAMMSQPVRSV